MRIFSLCLLIVTFAASPVLSDRAGYMDLARRGWNYELRSTMVGRDMNIPVHINGRDLAGASLCLVGERPHPASLEIIDTFRALAAHVFGKPVTMRYAGPSASGCGSGRTVILRLYSGFPPNRDLSADLQWMNGVYDLGLRAGSDFAATSPAMAQTFFGKRGQGTHIMVKQPRMTELGPLEAIFYKSILIEELFQSFSFGMDILLFDRAATFRSKLQETPVNLFHLSWESHAFMRSLVTSNPSGLCPFDVFMLHAVAEAPVEQTVDPAFIQYIDDHYDDLLAQADATLADDRFASIVDLDCARLSI
jgi:hypothetical protein